MGPDEPVVEPARAVEAGEAEPGLPPGHIADAQPAAGAESALDQKVAGRAHDLEADGPPAAAAGGQRPELELELERLLMTDFGEGATAAEFDAVAAQALALMGAKDSHGRAFDDSDFMQHKDYQRSHLELGEAQALTGAIAAGLLNRLTQGYDESRFRRWACGSRVGVHRLRAAPSGTAAGDDDAGEEAVAGAGSRAAAAGRAPATRVVLVSVLLAHATSREVPELEAKKIELESRVEKEESALDAMMESLKGEMAKIGAELDAAQRELQPWEGKIGDAKARPRPSFTRANRGFSLSVLFSLLPPLFI